jgi:uncharacterized protein
MITDELQKLRDLYEQGTIDTAEYAQIKQRLLHTDRAEPPNDLFGLSLPSYNALLHASQYAGYLIPYVGLIFPFILWLRVRDRYPEVDAHGKCAVNWIITEIIFTTILVILGVGLFFSGLIGMSLPGQPLTQIQLSSNIVAIFGLVGLWLVAAILSLIKLLGVIFPLIAAVQALDGRTFQYPFAIRFLK